MLLPLSGSGYLLAGVLLTLWFYALMCTWPQPFRATVLHIDQHGALYWQQQVLASGQLSQRSLITNWLLLLDWQDSQGQMHQLCLFRDQLTEQDYRALARQLQLQRWRGPSVNR
ncbi:hypothetical protein GCM10010919_12410 [Alishewanella longhuensis]|uniref:Toxin CptA n=2 Tax=Alishewanella longhuensis TaxID=1091037 RepID=A0ABQ3L0Y5_9ALTE|nr:hypothetical protein GCM10010919_12410 [Alishewanella longhuensis]